MPPEPVGKLLQSLPGGGAGEVADRDLPVLHGDAVCRRLGRQGMARILRLTASGAVEDRVDGLRLGADDYLDKAILAGGHPAQWPAPAGRTTWS
jgi:hypothetical protein